MLYCYGLNESVVGTVWCMVERLEASVVSTHSMPIAFPVVMIRNASNIDRSPLRGKVTPSQEPLA